MAEIFIILVSGLFAVWGTGKLIPVLQRTAIFDRPNERSMHKLPIPRGGGWVFVALIFVVLGAMSVRTKGVEAFVAPALALGVALLALISWHDDKGGVRAVWRFFTQFIAVGLALAAIPLDLSVVRQGYLGVYPPDDLTAILVERCILAVAWVWFINLTNFMDGIDGITGTETASISFGILGLLVLLSPYTHPVPAHLGWIAAALLGGSLGFLRHNWHPAKIFLGDVGSVPLGFVLGYMLLRLAMAGYGEIALILPLYYLADSGITLGLRILKGEKFWQAHRTHFYQKAAVGLGRHDRVVFRVLGANLALILVGGACFLLHPWLGFLAPAIVGALLLILHRAGVTSTAG